MWTFLLVFWWYYYYFHHLQFLVFLFVFVSAGLRIIKDARFV